MPLRRIPIHRVSTRPSLLFGADREMVLMLTLVTAILTVWAMNWVAFVVGVILWGLGLWALRMMAKADPLMRHLYVRARRYKRFYPPRSTPWRTPPSPSWFSRAINALSQQSNDHLTHH